MEGCALDPCRSWHPCWQCFIACARSMASAPWAQTPPAAGFGSLCSRSRTQDNPATCHWGMYQKQSVPSTVAVQWQKLQSIHPLVACEYGIWTVAQSLLVLESNASSQAPWGLRTNLGKLLRGYKIAYQFIGQRPAPVRKTTCFFWPVQYCLPRSRVSIARCKLPTSLWFQ